MSVLAGVVSLAIYLAITPAVAGDKDSSEFTLVLAVLGTAHPTGYPLYTLIGHGFVVAAHAMGATWDWAANAWSAVGGALAMGLLHAVAARLLVRQRVGRRTAGRVALLAVGVCLLNPLVAVENTLAEVTAFHLAWVAGALLVLLAAVDRLRGPDPAGDVRLFAGLGAFAGLGLAHHLTSVLVLAPVGLAVFALAGSRRRLRPAVIGAALAGMALPLASYAWIAWRAYHPGALQWPTLEGSWHSVWGHVTGREFQVALGRADPPSEVQRHAMARYLWPWFWPLAAAALLWAWRGRGTAAPARAAWVGILLTTFGYAFTYRVSHPSTYYLPAFLVACAAAPAGLATLAPLRRHGRVFVAAAAVALLAVNVGWFGLGRMRVDAYRRFEQRVHAMWRAVPFDSGFVLWPSDMIYRLRKYQMLDGEKTPVAAMNPIALTREGPRRAFVRRHGFDPADRARLEARIAAQPPTVHAFSQAVGLAIAEEINERSPLPVVIFRPDVPELRLLDKPGADSTAVPGARGR